jgi:N-acetylmuramoyl-L-alanine amidase
MSKMKIALDAGHGLHTAGRRCLAYLDPSQTREWQLNDRIMDRLEEELRGYACEVLRVDDTTGAQDVGLSTRVQAANHWGADLYLSMHHNAGIGGKSGGGTVVYHYCSTAQGQALAEKLYQRIVAGTGLIGNRSSKVVRKAYYVLANTKMRGYLVENGFMDSTADTPVIITETHTEKTVRGILAWLEQDCGLCRLGAAVPEEDKPLDVDADPADLSAGVEVIVDGMIYATGMGKGAGIPKIDAHMYITEYAGDRYPYCWGVAKAPGGTRQGWARAEDLQIVPGEDESQIDGITSAYREWPALCNERDVNVRIGPGVDKPILKAWPKLGPGNEVDVTGEGQAPNGRLWYQIRIAGVHTGWVYGGYLDKR